MHPLDKKILLKQFSIELKKARHRMEISQDETSKRAGMSLRGYQEVEAGNTDPQLTTATAISLAVNTSIPALLGKESTSDLIVDILHLLPSLNEKQLKSVRSLAETALSAPFGV